MLPNPAVTAHCSGCVLYVHSEYGQHVSTGVIWPQFVLYSCASSSLTALAIYPSRLVRRQVHQADLIDWMIFQQPLFCGLSTTPFLLLEHLIFYKHNTRCLMSLTTVLVLNHNLQMKEHCGKKIISNQLQNMHHSSTVSLTHTDKQTHRHSFVLSITRSSSQEGQICLFVCSSAPPHSSLLLPFA